RGRRRRSDRRPVRARLRATARRGGSSGSGPMTHERTRLRIVRPTLLTWIAALASLAVVAGTVAYLLNAYPTLPDILPVRFNGRSYPIGWQYKTYVRVLMPTVVQGALVLILGGIATLILSRPHAGGAEPSPDIVAASTAAEAIALVGFVWIAFQAYAAAALVLMWQRSRAGVGTWYSWLTFGGVVLS